MSQVLREHRATPAAPPSPDIVDLCDDSEAAPATDLTTPTQSPARLRQQQQQGDSFSSPGRATRSAPGPSLRDWLRSGSSTPTRPHDVRADTSQSVQPAPATALSPAAATLDSDTPSHTPSLPAPAPSQPPPSPFHAHTRTHADAGAANMPSTAHGSITDPVWTFCPIACGTWASSHSHTAPPAAATSTHAHAQYLTLARAFSAMERDRGGKGARINSLGRLINAFRAILGARGPRTGAPRHDAAHTHTHSRTHTPADADVTAAVLLCLGCIGNPHEPHSTLKLGGATVSAALQEVSGASRASLSRMCVETGDLGDVAARLARSQRTLVAAPPLTLHSIMTSLRRIASDSGAGSMQRKQAVIVRLLTAAREDEIRYLTRTLIANMRIGANSVTVLGALARAVALADALQSLLDAHGVTSLCGDCSSGQDVARAVGAAPCKSSAKDAGTALAGVPEDIRKRMEDAADAVRLCFSRYPDIPATVAALCAGGVPEMLRVCVPHAGMPVQPMLARITEGLNDVLDACAGRWVAAEYKYDGQRAQIHGWHDADGHLCFRVYSRNLEDTTTRWPDVLQLLQDHLRREPAPDVPHLSAARTSFIVDAELVAVAPDASAPSGVRILPFQVLSTRGRANVAAASVDVHVCVYMFDVIMVSGTPLMDAPFRERRTTLKHLFAWQPGVLELANAVDVLLPPLAGSPAADSHSAPLDGVAVVDGAGSADDVIGSAAEEALSSQLRASLAAGCEGLMVKVLDAGDRPPQPTYQPAIRSNAWLKVKKDYVDGLADTLDVVPIGAWYGNGRKAGWFSPILLAVYDAESDEYQSLCRCMSGFTDVFYRELTAFYQAPENQLSYEAARRVYATRESPDVWFAPCRVWEIKGADLTLSPVHMAAHGRVHTERGLGLRFPRFLRDRSHERTPDSATSSIQVAELFSRAAVRHVGRTAPPVVADNDGDDAARDDDAAGDDDAAAAASPRSDASADSPSSDARSAHGDAASVGKHGRTIEQRDDHMQPLEPRKSMRAA